MHRVLSDRPDRLQLVVLNGFQSRQLEVSCGLPQGLILRPTLFSMFINDSQGNLSHCRRHLFVDDFQLYKSVRENSVFAPLKMNLLAISA